jgi:hypothetical protein
MRPLALVTLWTLMLWALARSAHARPDAPGPKAAGHFQRGVDLYNEGDFRGALVELRKAYALWPRPTVLYDVGQTEYALLDYADALKSMERYLADTGPNAPHRDEVESTVAALRDRVGQVALSTDTPDCAVSIDERPVGTTPLSQPICASVGWRTVMLSCPGRSTLTRQVEVAPRATVRLDLRRELPSAPAPSTASTATPVGPRRSSLILAWSATGLLAAGTAVAGALALVEQGELERLKQDYPVTKAALDHQSATTLGLSIATDALAVVSLAAAGIATWVTVKYKREHPVRIGLGPSSVSVSTTF